MTARSSRHLAVTLRTAGFVELADRAEKDEFHDFLSPHALPELELDNELIRIIRDDRRSERERTAAHMIRLRLHDGEFDASLAESDEWARSPEGKAALAELVRKPRP